MNHGNIAKAVNSALALQRVPDGYITGLGRDVPHPRIAHLYKGDFSNPGDPMCRRGWNRDDGQSYSIWRGNVGDDGVCKVCMRRALAGKPGVTPAPRARTAT